MIVVFFVRLLWLLLLLALQVLIFNHVHFLGYATPLVYVYFLFLFPLNASRSGVMLWSFALGLAVDVFSNTPGVAAASMTLAALAQPPLLKMMAPEDSVEDAPLSFRTMGRWVYVRYVVLLSLLYHAAFFLLEFFSFFNVLDLLLSLAGSWLLTLAFCLAFEGLRSSR